MEIEKKIDKDELVIRVAEIRGEQGRWLLGVIESMHHRGMKIEDGVRFRLGWSTLIFRKQTDGRLLVCEPDFMGNPFEDEVDTLDATLDIQSRQNAKVIEVGVAPMAISFQDKIIVSKGALDLPSLYMERKAPVPEKHDSGWYIGERDFGRTKPASELEAIFAYQLLRYRPHLLDMLTLPSGYLVFVNGDEIERVIGPQE